MTKTCKRLAGFTLMELLIVIVIIIGLFAFLVPFIGANRKKINDRRADMAIKTIQAQLELYFVEQRGYPTTEQGLYALYYVPDNYGMTTPGQSPLPGGMPGSGMDPGGYNPSGTGGGVGGITDMLNPTSGGTSGSTMEMPNPMMGNSPMTGTNPMVGTDPMTGSMMDPMGGMGGTGGTGGFGGTVSTWTQPTHNPQLYQRLKKRPSPYIELKQLTDPWGQPYRYDSTLDPTLGINRFTGTATPAIWSAGYDKKDYTDDDITSWDPAEAVLEMNRRQQEIQMQGQGLGAGVGGLTDQMSPGGGMTMPPGGGMTMPPGGMTMPPGGGMTMPPGGMTMPPGGMTMPPGGGMTMPPGGGMTMPPGGGMTMPPGGVPQF